MAVNSTNPTPLYAEIVDFLTSTPNLEAILTFQLSESLQQRASHLLDRDAKGVLTVEEKHELEDFARMNHLLQMMKNRAYQKLAKT